MQPSTPLSIDTGVHVELELVDRSGERERLAFDIVPDRSADFANGFLGEGTPLAQAIRGHRVGEIVPYRTGDVVEARLLVVTPGVVRQSTDVEARRQETIRKAVQQSDLTNAVVFASSFSGKWGDYDPSGLLEDWEHPKETPPPGAEENG
jgi:hypothetical protein